VAFRGAVVTIDDVREYIEASTTTLRPKLTPASVLAANQLGARFAMAHGWSTTTQGATT
jgi:hypothetical protein